MDKNDLYSKSEGSAKHASYSSPYYTVRKWRTDVKSKYTTPWLKRFKETQCLIFLRILIDQRTIEKIISMYVKTLADENMTPKEVYSAKKTSQHCSDASERH